VNRIPFLGPPRSCLRPTRACTYDFPFLGVCTEMPRPRTPLAQMGGGPSLPLAETVLRAGRRLASVFFASPYTHCSGRIDSADMKSPFCELRKWLPVKEATSPSRLPLTSISNPIGSKAARVLCGPEWPDGLCQKVQKESAAATGHGPGFRTCTSERSSKFLIELAFGWAGAGLLMDPNVAPEPRE